jgi:Asp-tRNA(Asn)/Glu-tRNA(Gln) amidotransferase A subunit family amidase
MIDAKGMATTFGSVMFKDFYPETDAFVVEKLKKAGAIILGKATTAEFVGGDTYGSLFGATLNPYDNRRTVGGSSGGTAASVAANLTSVGVAQKNAASTRRPAAWTAVVAMRPTSSLISRTGSYGGWPSIMGSLTPMTRTVSDLAKLLDVMVGYDPEDPFTALGVGNAPTSYTTFLDKNGLKGARLGVIRESLGDISRLNPSEQKDINDNFENALSEVKSAGAELVDPLVIPKLKELLAKRVRGPEEDESFNWYFSRHSNAPYKSRQEIISAPEFARVFPEAQQRLRQTYTAPPEEYHQYLLARQELTIIISKLMADLRLDALLYKSMEGPPPLIRKGTIPSSEPGAGFPTLNTFLVFAPAITVPAGFTKNGLPLGITFQGRPYADGHMIKLAYGYEQATKRRKPPALDDGARQPR